ncbi:MAG TPA: hypothetical protein VGN57_18700 [Pirellulaceae bacterium]|nr:hypothetical protein [Pirellulaceae bacterium]
MWENYWTHSYDLRKGLLHGIKRTWNGGVHWSDEPYYNGRLHGTAEVYWDNGRVRTRTVYYRHVHKSEEEFPKFDDPRPVVKIDVQANEKLYRGWGVTPLDAYPSPKNLEKVESQLPIPDFLQDVYRRHLAGTPRSSYEDVNTFDDRASYLAIIDAKGSVTEVRRAGASADSAPVIGPYPDVVRKLKFEPGAPGRTQGREQGRRHLSSHVRGGRRTAIAAGSRRRAASG